jgi:valyl-tRNA synthetase
MPFVTSEIYESLIKFEDKELMMSKWPEIKNEFVFNKEEQMVENLKEIIVGIRNVRANMNIHPTKKAELIFVTKDHKEEIENSKDFILKLGFGKELKVQDDKSGIASNAISIMSNGIEVYMPFEDLVDIKEEIERLEKEKTRLEGEVLRGEKMLSNPGFVNKAPESKINEEKAKLENYKQMLKTVEERLKSMK